jgi:SAM-dependent methyltransferase
MTYRELLIGCGHRRDKRLKVPPRMEDSWASLTTLDWNPDMKPDVICDLNGRLHSLLPFRWVYQGDPNVIGDYPSFDDSTFDEIHAYEVLEHLGQQGDARAFFDHFAEIWRLLKPNGYLCATVPSRHSPWAWGDPSHTRLITRESLVFLDQSEYIRQLDGEMKSPMSDFRNIYAADFRLCAAEDDETTFAFVLQAVKPARGA